MYLGIPLLVAIGVIVVVLRRRGIVQLAGALTLVSLILSLGSTLYVGGHDTHLPLPFAVLVHLPLTQGFLASRFSLYTILFGCSDRRHRSRCAPSPPGHLSPSGWGHSAPKRSSWPSEQRMTIALIVAVPTLPLHQQPTICDGRVSPFLLLEAVTRNIPDGSALLAYPYSDDPAFPGTRRILLFAAIPISQRRPLGPGRVRHAFSTDRRLCVAAKWSGVRDAGSERPAPRVGEGSLRLRLLRRGDTSRTGRGPGDERSGRRSAHVSCRSTMSTRWLCCPSANTPRLSHGSSPPLSVSRHT